MHLRLQDFKIVSEYNSVLFKINSQVKLCEEKITKEDDSSLAAAVAMAPFDSGFDPRQRRHLIRAQLVSQLIRVQLVLLD